MSKIVYRKITPGEYEAARQVWNSCFPEDVSDYSDYYFARRSGPEFVYAAFDGAVMAAALHAVPYPLSFYGTLKPCVMIAGVATLPRYRMHGIARELIKYAHEDSGRLGALAAVLKPDVDIYGRMGYIPFAYHRRFRYEGGNEGEESTLRLLTPAKAVEIYDGFVGGYNGAMIRSEADMAAYIEEAELYGEAVMNGEGDTYALFWEYDDRIEVSELAGKQPTELIRLLGRRGKPVEYRLPADFAGGEKTVFSMIYPINEALLLWGTGKNSLKELVDDRENTCLTLEFC